MGVWRHRRFRNDVDAKYSDPYWYKDSKETEVQQHLPEIWVFGDSVKFEGSGLFRASYRKLQYGLFVLAQDTEFSNQGGGPLTDKFVWGDSGHCLRLGVQFGSGSQSQSETKFNILTTTAAPISYNPARKAHGRNPESYSHKPLVSNPKLQALPEPRR